MRECRKQILVVDDHPLTRKGLCDAIRAQANLDVCGESASLAEAKAALAETRPDVLVLDLNLGDGNGWALIEQLAATGTLPPTLVLSVSDENLYATRLLDAGARGYLMKSAPIDTVLAAIRKILAGHIAVSDAMATALFDPRSGAAQSEAHAMQVLSDRELQVFEMLAQGLSNKEIAAQLNISAKTIGTYKTRLMEKLGVRTTPKLFELAAMRKSAGGSPAAGCPKSES